MEMEDMAAPALELDAAAATGDKPHRTSQDLPSKMRRPAAQQPPADACFDCNICLDFAADPVVTLCGHLYCWPCIYKWLRVPDAQFDPEIAASAEDDDPAASVPRQQQCPVCKAALSESALVPLYGRGIGDTGKGSQGSTAAAAALAVPRRPLPSMLPLREDTFEAGSQPPHQHRRGALDHGPARQVGRDYLGSVMSSTTVVHPLFHGVAMLPFLLFCGSGGPGAGSSYYADPYYHAGGGPAERRQEMQSSRSLHRVSCFLFLCVLLCLLLF